jgi:peptidoglycan/LPS O-acetylase OafA/YrhL
MEEHEMTTADAPTPARRPLSLHEKVDVCRGLFAALVVVAHSQEIAWGIHEGAKGGLSPAVREGLASTLGTGIYYVMGFFVLSGYCIHLSVARSMRADRFPARRYVVARLSRILPLYYLGLLVTVLVEWSIAGARPNQWPNGVNPAAFLGQLVMVQNLTDTFGAFASSWSITNEVFYYLFYGLLAWLLAGREARPAWTGLCLCLGSAIVGQVLYVTVGRNPVVYRAGMLMGLGMLWFQGALVAIHGRDLMQRGWVRHLAALWPAALAAAMAWRALQLPPQGIYLISGWAFTLMLLDFLRSPTADPPAGVGRWRSGLVTTLGLASYPLYLFHGPILMLAGSWVLRTGAITDWRLTWALLVALGLVSGVALGWLLERPVMAWRAGMLRRLKENEGAAGRGPRRFAGRAAAVRAVPEGVAAGAEG